MQAFINIINNSKDTLNPTDNIEDKYIFIEAKEIDNQCVITIKDNGGGIKLIESFEPYFATKHQSKGTGLGLAMTYKIITKMHQGTIIASNTTFEFNAQEHTRTYFTIIFSQEV